ncbi:related to MFS drug efflux pump [Lecanosticta acicola]|uniref:Related to MFS drug efflux pump n=1 Tax=Lecanosticta acicola TaxID=111012 RepID=A0AAI8YU77_9PEZI|nr:related to MFS drug efflux pump [Lecanosticta acicola]
MASSEKSAKINAIELGSRSGTSDEVSDGLGSEQSSIGENKLTLGFVMTMIGLSLALVVAELTPLFTATTFTIIANDLHATKNMVWITVSAYIAEGAMVPFVGSLSDLFGRRKILLFSLVVKMLACIIMASSPSLAPFLVGCVLSGFSIGIQAMTVISGVSELVPAARRGAMLGYIVMGFIPFGPAALYGQLIAQHNWRYIFLLIGILALLSFICLAIWYRPPPRTATIGLSRREMLRRIDYGGAFFSSVGLTLAIIGINWGGIDYPWKSAQVICMLTFGFLFLIMFGIYEKYFTKWPMFSMRVAKNKRMLAACCIICFASGVNYMPVTTFWGIQVYAVYGADWHQAGIWVMPIGFCVFGGCVIGAMLLTRFKRHILWVILAFCAMQTIGSATASRFDYTNVNTIWAPLIIALFGVGGVSLPNQVIFTVIAPDDLIGSSVAIAVVLRVLGQVVGKSVFFNIFSERLKADGPAIVGIPLVKAGFTSPQRMSMLIEAYMSGPISQSLHLFPELHSPATLAMVSNAVHQLYGKVLAHIYLMSLPWGLIACVSCLGLYGIGEYMDNHVAVHL